MVLIRPLWGENLQRFRGGLVFKAHELCVSLNARLESNNEEERVGAKKSAGSPHRSAQIDRDRASRSERDSESEIESESE